jgi:ribosomal protein L11 methyltransferase
MSNIVWCELEITVPVEEFEVVADVLQENGAGGVVFEDPSILSSRDFEADEIVSEELKENVAQTPSIKAYFPVDDGLGSRLIQLKEVLAQLLGNAPEFGLKQIHEDDWADAWKAYYKPEHIGNVVIKPSWEEYSAKPEETVVELDPGMAFGTGTHPTTRLCIKLLQTLINKPLEVLDVGTGSGILAITAAKLGAAKVTASDIDSVAVKVAGENVSRNGVSDRVAMLQGDLLQAGAAGKYDLVVANIIADIPPSVSLGACLPAPPLIHSRLSASLPSITVAAILFLLLFRADVMWLCLHVCVHT